MVGFCLLILLMLYVTYQDVLRFIIKWKTNF
jgi:membrane-associated protease RseP (regulator of RpoE activity)